MKRFALGAALVALCIAPAAAQVTPTETPASSFQPLSTPGPQLGPAISVDDVLAQSIEYDNKPVQATGTAQNVRVDETPGGPVLQFDLCGHHCLHVLDAENPTLADGQTTTISGTYHRRFTHGRFSQDNIMLIVPGGIRDDSDDWRHRLEGGYPPTPRPN